MTEFENHGSTSNKDENYALALMVEALYQLANARDWDETLLVIQEWDLVLLSSLALSFIHLMMVSFEANGDILAAMNWQQYLYLLQDAQNYGIEKAWACFKMQQIEAALAHDALVRVHTHKQLYIVLK